MRPPPEWRRISQVSNCTLYTLVFVLLRFCRLLNFTLNSAWKWPNIRGLETFQGDMFHTAHYKEGFDLKGKSVAVIGAGSSGVQTVASIYPDVSRLFTWVRSQTWITASIGQKFAGPEGQNFECTFSTFSARHLSLLH